LKYLVQHTLAAGFAFMIALFCYTITGLIENDFVAAVSGISLFWLLLAGANTLTYKERMDARGRYYPLCEGNTTRGRTSDNE